MDSRTDRGARAILVLAIALLGAACSGGASPSAPGSVTAGPGDASALPPASTSADPSGGAPGSGSSTASATVISASPSPTGGTASATAAGVPAQPPRAQLAGLSSGPVDGDLGSYTWRDAGSDAPWIVGPHASTATAGATLRISFVGTSAATWTASWAPVTGNVAGNPTSAAQGSGDVTVRVPATAGDWSLQVTASFGAGTNASYYWRVVVSK